MPMPMSMSQAHRNALDTHTPDVFHQRKMWPVRCYHATSKERIRTQHVGTQWLMRVGEEISNKFPRKFQEISKKSHQSTTCRERSGFLLSLVCSKAGRHEKLPIRRKYSRRGLLHQDNTVASRVHKKKRPSPTSFTPPKTQPRISTTAAVAGNKTLSACKPTTPRN